MIGEYHHNWNPIYTYPTYYTYLEDNAKTKTLMPVVCSCLDDDEKRASIDHDASRLLLARDDEILDASSAVGSSPYLGKLPRICNGSLLYAEIQFWK